MKEKIMKLLKNKKFMLFLVLFIILAVCVALLINIFYPSGGSNYGNRLDGIKKISFTKKDKQTVIDALKNNESVSDAKMNVHGKIINVIFDVNNDVNLEVAHNIANETLKFFSDDVKGFYDIQFIITKTKEEGKETKVTNSEGKEETKIEKEFPKMGYKNSKRDNIVW